MAKTFCIAFAFFCLSFFLESLVVQARGPLAPALYVFGDSLSDSGNNNYLQTKTKVNYTPYGIDFPYGPTGRFCNGRTFIDFIAQGLGLPLVPPYLGLSATEKRNIQTGINYASGAAGILPETSATEHILCLDDQIKYFERTLLTDLLWKFPNPFALFDYLSKSIFYVNIGSNDYINNYLQPAKYNSSKKYTPQQFADHLLQGLRKRLTKLYFLGARKFLVFNIGRIGCTPFIASHANVTTPCYEVVNNLILAYNTKFPSMISALENTLLGSTFILGDAYIMNKNSSEAGFTAPQVPCCELQSGAALCLEGSTPCTDRTAFYFWDGFHPTQATNRVVSHNCFNGSSCGPVNVQQLVQKQDVYSI